MTTSITPEDLRTAIPVLDGTLKLAGLQAPVDVVRDSLGIPHIRARSVADAFFAQGFVQAQDRLWQMEYDRRRALGRWAEYVGPEGVEQDVLMRRLGLAASARADYAVLSPETRLMLEVHAAGVNAFIASTDVLPVEYRLVGGSPEPWEPWHACAVFKVRHVLMGPLSSKLWRLRVLKTLGAEWITHLRTGDGDSTPLIVPPGVDYGGVPDPFDGPGALGALLLAEDDGGSNNWVVHGSRTASGSPLLAGDPHRALNVPNVYYQSHIVCPEFDAIGYAFAGIPGLPHFGHNAHVAWAVTHANTDYQDWFVERTHPEDSSLYEFQGAWRKLTRRQETIHVRGAASVSIEVSETHHGPIIMDDPASRPHGLLLALRYSATAEPNRGFDALLPMLQARTVAELDESMRPWVDPGNNFVMADTAGTIGYLTRGQVPVRSRANGWLPVPGWTGEHEWQGTLPFEDLPRARNPEQGFIATANQRIVGDEYPHYLSTDWTASHRARRVNAHLRPLTAATTADMIETHRDKLSGPSRAFVALAQDIEPLDAPSAAARARLLGWDGTMGPQDVPATIYAVFREQVTAAILAGPVFAPLVATGRPAEPLRSDTHPTPQRVRNSFYGLLKKRDPAVLPPGDTWETLGARALAAATTWLTQVLGPDQEGWRWERIHRTKPRHPLSATFPEVAPLLNPPDIGVGGDADTPQAATYACGDGQDYTLTSTSVARYCFDLADWNQSGWTVPLGASGHPGSPHYADQIRTWGEQRLSPMHYSWTSVEADAESRQRLEPG